MADSADREPAPAELLLGVSEQTLVIDSRAQLAEVSLSMVRQCARTMSIVSRHLDPPIYDNEAFTSAVKELVLRERKAVIRLLVIDSRPLVSRGHRLLELGARLPSFIEVRAPARPHRTFNEAMLLVDNEGYVHRQFSDRFEGTASFCDRRTVAALEDQFEEMWERGVTDPNFRRLHL